MKKLFLSLLVCQAHLIACTQSPALIQEVRAKLEKNTSNVSTVLTDKNYLALHDQTEFRQLIKKYADASLVKMATDDEPGKKILVTGYLKNEKNEPLSNIVVYLYQTDAKGWYAADRPHVGGNEGDRGHARLFAYVKTDQQGKFLVQTIKPSGYPQSDLPAHIHVEILDVPGYRTLITEFLFDDDERLVGNVREQSLRYGFINARPSKGKSPIEQEFSYTIVLKK